MKKLVLIAVAFFTLNAVAQEQKVKQEKIKTDQSVDNKVKKLVKTLELTPDQQEKVRLVFLDHNKEMQKVKLKIKEALKAENKMNKEEAKKTMLKQNDKIMTRTNSKLKEILTEEQYKKYKEMQHQNKKRTSEKKY
ncbi:MULTISPECIES: hypothetical protein [Winogradskyella]|uniref:LTXXQ motif family protein n=1 Tax=Winogradskyella ouciana TaxID=2608631 RepID=A0A7K1GGA3_9FLAO|nr:MULTISPECIES: hypothetical protein [Winogradskyella]MBO6881515.1 hypothetical protein [Winogradskyella sp.]MTE28055.1 hypothetical protein [Winogradskyella ouciana]